MPRADLLYGFHPVREALRHRPHQVQRVMIASRRGGARLREVQDLCRRHRVELVELSEHDLSARTGQGAAVHNGFAAELHGAGLHGAGLHGAERHDGAASPAARPRPPAPAAIPRDPDLVVLVEDVQDPRNLGALVRVCEGAGTGRLLVRDRGSAPMSPVAVKASAGASEWLPVERITNSAQALEALKADGYWVYGLAPGGDPVWELDLTGKVVLCFGGEEKGLRQRTAGLCDRLAGLPMRGRVESLNLSTAAAAVLFEAVRQRTTVDAKGKP
ncbi:MAG TPA: RNA methyltransferase [Thermoanaerobaculia bacterium]|nr:RNA methyltransferase [Thermoanaerobaculia bacterium]